MIRTAEHQFQNLMWPSDELATATLRLHWNRGDVPFHLPLTTSTESVPVHINHSRWLVQCPCGGAQYAAPDDPRFFCVDCLNEWVGGAWVKVVWPKNRTAIEEALMARPEDHQRNWKPGESVADLLRENKEHL